MNGPLGALRRISMPARSPAARSFLRRVADIVVCNISITGRSCDAADGSGTLRHSSKTRRNKTLSSVSTVLESPTKSMRRRVRLISRKKRPTAYRARESIAPRGVPYHERGHFE